MFEYRQVEDEPILIFVYDNPIEWPTEFVEVDETVKEMTRSLESKHIDIHDFSSIENVKLTELLGGMKIIFNPEGKLHTGGYVIAVGNHSWLKLGIDTMMKMNLSPIPIEMYLTMDEALERARVILAEHDDDEE